ncbi:helix-turn-helix transcriptional regulator [Sphaerospermopsis aphanizomenoides BCCUSP55]|nr:helix-turn-helix transcriptional regulator [Sphaerospermopsis aphanizomenoides BCCUSP55]
MKQENQESNRGSPLKDLREAAGLSQEQLARQLDVSLSTVRRWEKGKVEPSLTREKWVKFCSLLKVSFESLPLMLSKH